jgi:hypothetical protein
MDEDAIRRLLAGLPRASMVKHPPGTVAILRRTVQESGADPVEVERWIHERAGYLEIAPAIRSRALRVGRTIARRSGPTPYYVIPLQALEGPTA